MAVALAACGGSSGQGLDHAHDGGEHGEDLAGHAHDGGGGGLRPDLMRLDSGPPAPTGPALLSETGLYADFARRTLAAGVRAFAPSHPLWSDGSDKQRYLLLPPGATIDTTDMDLWRFPVGTRAWKEFRVGGKLVETRLLLKVREGAVPDAWFWVAYAWRPDGSDADAAPDGVMGALGTTHDIPAQDDCAMCHMHLADAPIGVSAIELSGAKGPGDLTAFAAAGLLSKPPGREFGVPGAGVAQQALGYLHGNCGYCHVDSAFFADKVRLRARLSVADTAPEQTKVYVTGIGGLATHEIPEGVRTIIKPGLPDESQLYTRMARRDLEGMPALGTKVVDTAALATMRDWIRSLPR